MSDEKDQTDYRLDVLRAAGHTDAAELLSKLPTPAPAASEPEEEAKPAGAAPTIADARRQEAEGLRDTLNKSITSPWINGGAA